VKSYIKPDARTIAGVSLDERGDSAGGISLEGYSTDTAALETVVQTLIAEGYAADFVVMHDKFGTYKLTAYKGDPAFMGPM
jgi:hypothetical protein